MASSLILDNQFELLGSGAMIDSGLAAGAVIRLGGSGSGSGGTDFGAGEPQTALITSLLLDGERPVGRRTGNATINLPIYVIAPGMNALMAAREQVLQIIDQEIWTLTLTLEGMQPTIFDCLRGKASSQLSLRELGQDVVTFNVTAPRLPFGRSDIQETINIPAPPGTPGGGTISTLPNIVLDEFDSGTLTVVGAGATWTYSTSVKYSGTASAYTWGASALQRTLSGGLKNLTGYTAVTFYVAVTGGVSGYRTYRLSFFDDGNRMWDLGNVSASLPSGNRFVKLTLSLTATQPSTGFRKDRIQYFQFRNSGGTIVDCLTALGPSVNVVGGSRGGLYEIHDVIGSARAPINVDINRPSGSNITTGIVHRPATVPDCYTPLLQLDPAVPLDGRLLTLPDPIGQTSLTERRWDGTYSLVLSIASLVGTSTQSRTTDVRIGQYSGSLIGTIAHASRTYTPAEIGSRKYLYLGRLDIPMRGWAPDHGWSNWEISITCTGIPGGITDSFTDLLFLDTEGETIMWENTFAKPHVYVDEPDPITVNHGALLIGDAREISANYADCVTALSGGPLSLDPGENSILVHCWDGAAQLTVTYTPRWHGVRIQ